MQWLDGYSEARLTGTGACIFAEFDSRAAAEQVQQQVPEHWTAVVAKGLNKSNCHTALEDL
jgi:4-diphosphocytidyl-2-C-methyl-D-erythritol kinase